MASPPGSIAHPSPIQSPSPVRILKREAQQPNEELAQIHTGPNQTFIVRHVPKDERGTSRYLFARISGVFTDIFVHRTEFHGDFFNLVPGSVLYGTIDIDERQDSAEGTRYVAKDVYLAIPHMMATIGRLMSDNYSYHCRLNQLEAWQTSLANPAVPETGSSSPTTCTGATTGSPLGVEIAGSQAT
mgnify:CR=1 FL=1